MQCKNENLLFNKLCLLCFGEMQHGKLFCLAIELITCMSVIDKIAVSRHPIEQFIKLIL